MLEPVQVNDQECSNTGVAARHCMIDTVTQQRSVREPGQRIVERAMAQLRFEPVPLGDVTHVHHHTRNFGKVQEVLEDLFNEDAIRAIPFVKTSIARLRKADPKFDDDVFTKKSFKK